MRAVARRRRLDDRYVEATGGIRFGAQLLVEALDASGRGVLMFAIARHQYLADHLVGSARGTLYGVRFSDR